MRYVLKQKFWSWGDDFRIRDADGQDVFFVDGRAFSWGDKLSFQDMQKNELAFIRQKLLSWGPTYEIDVHGRLVAVVKKKLFTLLRCKFTVDVPGPDDPHWLRRLALARGATRIGRAAPGKQHGRGSHHRFRRGRASVLRSAD